jgi:predicted component of type VI protein secretion system
MAAYLLSLGAQPDIPIDGALVVVGRNPQCDVRLDSHRVSRRHCCLTAERDGLFVRDLGSANGTWINGRRIAIGLVRRGDELAIAHLRYRLESGPPPARPAPGPAAPPADAASALETSRDDPGVW